MVCRWAYWLWMLITVLLGLLALLRIYFTWNNSDGPVKLDKKPASFADYKTDVFFWLPVQRDCL